MKIDAHQHFWKYTPQEYGWISEEMSVIRRDFLPPDLQPELKKAGFDGSVAVQAPQTEEETHFLLDLADHYSFIKGVVGWIDLQAANVEERLSVFARHPKLCGIRHVVQAEPDDHFLLKPAFKKGVSLLEKFKLTYDILIYPKQLPAAIEFVATFPRQKFVLDHIAKPFIKDHITEPWDTNIRRLAAHENVYCKLSGMVTEANWKQWKKSDFTPYLETVLEAFGPNRLMIGSDWPVCKVAGEYSQVMQLVQEFISTLSTDEQARILGRNAIGFYGLKV
ncbi:amidohydrolase family protein [Rhodocytophaga rosea]|uniref:Amidohydrolase family protein n=1 Tax=Rhodocytophaga rosea TaxID=2704465 RepID=A0A6C0GMB7_9BACT|nr:amidohydrolase family protein [Rhodocytophaga rosea]QHT69186.1 amidohydrolase family protein [Rhodocytophaga rosea]